MAARIKPAGATQQERDRLSLGVIESLIDGMCGNAVICPSCKKPHKISSLDTSVVTAMRMRYDKLRPTLSAVEQTTHNESEKLDENQLLAKLEALIAAHPDLVQRALAAAAKRKAGVAEVPKAAIPVELSTDNTGNAYSNAA